jgi:hypothetical protein
MQANFQLLKDSSVQALFAAYEFDEEVVALEQEKLDTTMTASNISIRFKT